MPSRIRRLTKFIPVQAPACYSDYMLSEMLARHEDLLKQLRAKRNGLAGDSSHLTGLINQHEDDAVQIGLLLEDQQFLVA